MTGNCRPTRTAAAETYGHRGQFTRPFVSTEDQRPLDILASSIGDIVAEDEGICRLHPPRT